MNDSVVRMYERGRQQLLADENICLENRNLYRRFFEFLEYKLRRQNGIGRIDEASGRTLCAYIARIRNVNTWFYNKPLISLEESDIRRVYDELEDGVIVNSHGERFKCRSDYYNKIFKSKLFEMAGKKELAKKVVEFATPHETDVRFTTEEGFRQIVGDVTQLKYRLLCWLAFDYGENINSLLQLNKSDFYRQSNPHTHEAEYRVQFRREGECNVSTTFGAFYLK